MSSLYPECISRLSKAIQFRTVSDVKEDGKGYLLDPNETTKYLSFLKLEFPEVFSSQKIEVMTINSHSILIHVQVDSCNSKCHVTGAPFLLIAHTDVVPVEEKHWTVPPFDGLIKVRFLTQVPWWGVTWLLFILFTLLLLLFFTN